MRHNETTEVISSELLPKLQDYVVNNYKASYYMDLIASDVDIQYITYIDRGIVINYLTPLSSYLKSDLVPFRVLNDAKEATEHWDFRRQHSNPNKYKG